MTISLGTEFTRPTTDEIPDEYKKGLDPSVALLWEIRQSLARLPLLLNQAMAAQANTMTGNVTNAAILAAREAIAATPIKVPQQPTPIVHVDAPDLSEIVMAVTGLRPGATADDIGAAIAKNLNPPAPGVDSEMMSAFEKLVEKIDFRLQGVGRAFGSSGPSNISDNPNRQLGVVTIGAGTLALGPVSTASVVAPVTGQTTWTSGAAVQMSSTSKPMTNGILVQGLKANTNPVYVGATGVTTSTGFELQAGQAISFTCANANLLYLIGTHGGDGVCYTVD